MGADYTQGPWFADDGECGEWGIFAEKDKDAIAYLLDPITGRLREVLRPTVAEDNAKLIASSPELFEALDMAFASLRDINNGWPINELHEPLIHTIERAKEALLKAGWVDDGEDEEEKDFDPHVACSGYPNCDLGGCIYSGGETEFYGHRG